jgi:hypothetical protein
MIRFGFDLVMIYRPDQVLGVSQELIANIEYACRLAPKWVIAIGLS